MELLEKLLAGLTNLTWVTATQSYRIGGPPGSFSSGETTISRGRLCSLADREKVGLALEQEVEEACRKRMPETMHCLVEMVDEWEESRPA